MSAIQILVIFAHKIKTGPENVENLLLIIYSKITGQNCHLL